VIIAITCVIAIVVIVFVLGVRPKDLPEPEPVSPFPHLDERKAAIYENLRDLQFEYRVGKLSDQDYQQTKQDLQKELAGVLAEIDKLKQNLASHTTAPVQTKPAKKQLPQRFICPSCNAEFSTPLKFCGECGKPMAAAQA
jgi:rRNA maturation endonuclease Nob1